MKRGWCPSLTAPMPAADGLLLRLRPRHERLDAGAARRLADEAECHGNGVIELTNRGSLQLRGFSPASAQRFAEAIEAAGIAAPAGQDRVLVSPLLGADPALHPDTEALADAIAAHIAPLSFTGAAKKFLVAVDGGGVAGLGAIRADLVFRAERRAWHLLIDGAGHAFRADDPARAAASLVDRLLARRGEGIDRMRDLAAVMERAEILALAGLAEAGPPAGPPPPPPVGFLEYGPGCGAFGIGLPFGTMDAATLRRLAGLAEHFGDGALRLTPSRVLLLTGVASPGALATAARPLITDAADPRLAIAACIGRPRCASATTDTRADALRLAAMGLGQGVHLSGCAKGCAHPAPARATLVGRDGLYDLVRDDTASGAPLRTGLTLAEAALSLEGLA